MDEKGLLELWNVKRTQVISAQMGPTIMLIAVLVLAAIGAFDAATDSVRYLAIGIAAATGILAMITQYATIREPRRWSRICRSSISHLHCRQRLRHRDHSCR